MSTEDYLFEVYTQTSAGSRWTLNLMANIYDMGKKEIEHHGRFITEEEVKDTFPSFFKLDKLIPPMKDEDVNWELFYTMLRDWYKIAREPIDNKTSEQLTDIA